MPLITDPKKIEARSFELIENHLCVCDPDLSGYQKAVVKRVIHASADLNYTKSMRFSPDAIAVGLKAIKKGKNIIADVNMVCAGINKKILKKFGGKVLCFLNDQDVLQSAYKSKTTKAIAAMKKAAEIINGDIVAIGNAPTALFELCDLVIKKKVNPALIVAMPVGFVGAKEAKKKVLSLGIPYITNRGRKGGSSVACAIINALLKIAKKESE